MAVVQSPRRLYRKPFGQAGNAVIFELDLPKNTLLKSIDTYLRGQLVGTGAGANGTAVTYNPFGLIARIDVDATPEVNSKFKGGKLKSLGTRALVARRKFDRGTAIPDLRVGAAGITGAAGTFTFNSMVELVFGLPRLLNPIESALRLDQYRSVRITITTQPVSAMLNGNAQTWDYSGLYFELELQLEDLNGGANENYLPLIELFEDDKTVQVQRTDNRLSVDQFLPAGESYIDILAIAETTNGALSDAIINKAIILQGGQQVEEPFFDTIKARQQKFITDQAESMVGMHYLPLVPGLEDSRGLLTGVVPNVGMILDVNQVGVDRIFLTSRRAAARRA